MTRARPASEIRQAGDATATRADTLMGRQQEPGSPRGSQGLRGEHVRRARRRRGLSLAATAQLMGKSKGWLSMVENGRLQLDRLSDIIALAGVLEVPVPALIGVPCPGCPRPSGGGGRGR